MDMGIKGRKAIVCAASKGLGKGCAMALAQEGVELVINARTKADLEATAAEIMKKTGVKVTPIAVDVTTEAGRKMVLDACPEPDIIVNNAGYARHGMIQNTPDDLWEAMLAVHLTAPFRLLRAAAPHIREAHARERAEGGVHHRKVVNVSSGSIAGVVGHSGYASAKAGLLGLTTTLAKEWGRYAVNVNAVAFGLIETRMSSPLAEGETRNAEIGGATVVMGMDRTRFNQVAGRNALGRAGTPEEAAGAIFLLCLPEADYISGQCLTVNGG